jgi:hypothetical protein
MKRLFIIIWLLVPVILPGATTGKIMGKVVDGATREPLPLVNVSVMNTSLGAITNNKGYYFIINIPPGKYKMRVQMMGYRKVVKSNISVDAGKTAFVNFELEETVLEFKEAITVTAKRHTR